MRVKLLTPPYICIGIAPRLLTPPISMPEAAARTIEKAMGTPKATNNISVPTNSIAIIWLPLCCSYRLHRYLPLL